MFLILQKLSLHIHPNVGGYAECFLQGYGDIKLYAAFAVDSFANDRWFDAGLLCELFLRDATLFEFVF